MATKKALTAARRSHRFILLGACGALVALGVGIALAITHGADTQRSTTPSSRTKTERARKFALASVKPTAGTTLASAQEPITVSFTAPLDPSTPLPSVEGGVTGQWTQDGPSTLVFHPSGNYVPFSPLIVVVPSGTDGIAAKSGAHLAEAVRVHYTAAGATMLRLQQLLAELNYLPLSFTATGVSVSASTPAIDSEPTNPEAISTAAQPGALTWRFAHIPRQLALNWSPGSWNLVTKGAIMAFEADHNLAIDGEPGPAVWGALLSAVATRQATTRPYDYILTTETVPETLYVWQDGKVVLQSPDNTGVDGAATPLGTWPVYLRYTSTTMTGTNPDGTHYSDPGVPWVSYFNGSDAVHGFIRPVYGVPQSDGCVELPVPTAAEVFPLDPYGTLVTVTTGDLAAELDVAPPSPVVAPTPPPTTTTTTTLPATTTTTTTLPRPTVRSHPPVAPTTTSTTTTTTTTLPATTTTSTSTPS